ncbi:MAG TPA: cell envelope integrity protein CreD [Lacunisphaera sp.]|jgi:inner membrane protein
MNSLEPPVIVTSASRRFFLFLKIGGICLLIGLLHVPLALMHGVLKERQGLQLKATDEIAGIWGRQQLVMGPVLAIPYQYKKSVVKSKVFNGRAMQVEETELAEATAYFLPEALVVDGSIDPEVRHRGIYEAVVYSSKASLTGNFQPDFTVAGIEADRIEWEKAQVQFGVSDLHGIRSVGPIQVNGGTGRAFESVENDNGIWSLKAKLDGLSPAAKFDFSFELALQGSEQFEVTPVGKVTTVLLSSSWSDPSFSGAYLPVKRDVGAGFSAEWKTAPFSRGFPAAWTDRTVKLEEMSQKIAREGFGVRFAQPVNGYGVAERAQKYGLLFFVLVFAVFFLFEITAGVRIHPLQYAMVGAALCVFFLGFLALTEFWPVGPAYAVSAAACTLLVSSYTWSFLKTGARTVVIGGGLGATYGYLFFVLKSQDYALLAGTAALFAALALVMFCTRKINWYGLELNAPPVAPDGR